LKLEKQNNLREFLNNFKTPPCDFYPVSFWSWNDLLEKEELKDQIDLMAQGKMGGVTMHSRVGLITPYIEKQWFDAVHATIEFCKEKGLKAWIYDEDGYPSGFAGGAVPLENPSYRMKMLLARPENIQLPDQFEKIEKPSSGFQIYKYTVQLDSEWFNGTNFVDTMNPKAVEHFIKKSYQIYYDNCADAFGKTITAEFTDEPCPLYRLNIPAGAVPYNEHFFIRFREMHGYDAHEKLHLLFTDQAGALSFRLHYFRTINDLFETSFSKQIGKWCKEHGIDMAGHYMAEGSIYDQQLWGFKIMPNYRHMGIPGIDMLGKTIDEKIAAKQCQSVVNQYSKKRMLTEIFGVTGSSLTFQDRLWLASQQLCLGANLFIPHLFLYTMAGCRKRDFPPNLFYQQPWWNLNELVHTPLARLAYALSQGTYNAKVLLIHPQESAVILWKTKWQVENVNHAEYDQDNEPIFSENKNAIFELDSHLSKIIDELLGSQIDFDFGDETILSEIGKIISNKDSVELNLGPMSYQVIILPAMLTISPSTFELLKQFHTTGGIILQCGRHPEYLDGVESPELVNLLKEIKEVDINQLANCIYAHLEPAIELLNSEGKKTNLIWSHTRNLNNGDAIVYLSNLDRLNTFETKIKFNGPWQSLYLLDKWTGDQKKLTADIDSKNNCAILSITFNPADDYLLLLSKREQKENEKCISLVHQKTKNIIQINESQWEINRINDNAIILDYAFWAIANDNISAEKMPVIAIQQWLDAIKYNGNLKLKFPVTVRSLNPVNKVHLIVEHPERYKIFVNGRKVAYAGLPYWCDIRWLPIDITGMLIVDSENYIELQCDNFQYGNKKETNDKFARYGTEIEPIYLIGDFGVYGKLLDETPISPLYKQWNLPPVQVRCFKENSLYITNSKKLSPGDTTIQGMPFYSGTLELKTQLPQIIKNTHSKIALKIDKFDAAVAGAYINGKLAGYFFSEKSLIDITDLLNDDSKELKIVLYGTLRNLLGPHHHIEGEILQVSPFHCCPTFENRDDTSDILEWAKGKKQPFDWKHRYCCIGFGDIGSIRIYLY
jgi:hypothetical protein